MKRTTKASNEASSLNHRRLCQWYTVSHLEWKPFSSRISEHTGKQSALTHTCGRVDSGFSTAEFQSAAFEGVFCELCAFPICNDLKRNSLKWWYLFVRKTLNSLFKQSIHVDLMFNNSGHFMEWFYDTHIQSHMDKS